MEKRQTQDLNALYFRKYATFYKHLRETILSADTSIELTHVRPEPPSEFPLAKRYFEELMNWARDHPCVSVRRIISITNLRMYLWAKELMELTKDLSTFYVGVVGWHMDIPMVNMAVIDSTNVYLVVPSAVPETNTAIYIQDKTIGKWFSRYYDLLWSLCTPLEKWIRENESKYEIEAVKEESGRVVRPLF